jgi:3-oxoacyl-[acyl-carrier-protein] synthase III
MRARRLNAHGFRKTALEQLHGVRIVGVGHYVPEKVLSNADLERMFDTTDQWIVERTGMRERRIAPPDMPTSEMAAYAARHALLSAKLESLDMDAFIVATATPDYLFPATASLAAARLGALGKPAFDIEIACSGFVYALSSAASMVRAGVFRRVLVIGAEKVSAITDYLDRSTAILFGDGAGAVVLERSAENSFLSCELGADGSQPELLYVPGGGTREPLTPENDRRRYMLMQGREIFRCAVTKMAESAQLALERVGLTTSALTYMIPHQANKRIIDAVAKQLQMPPERVLVNIERYGNTSSASIPIALSEAVAAGMISRGDTILFVAFGGGLSWGSVVWQW